MPPHTLRRPGFMVLLGTLLAALPACSRKAEAPPLVRGQTVRGRVTYDGKPVPYGVVLFFNHGHSINPKTGTFGATSFATLNRDGSYVMENVGIGPVMVCVATDPDVELPTLMRPTAPGGGVGPGAGPPGAGPPGGIPGGPPGPGKAGGPPPGPKGGPPLPPGIPRDRLPPDLKGKGFNPQTEELSKEDKKMLKGLHARYGKLGTSPLTYVVREGEQTFDIKLK